MTKAEAIAAMREGKKVRHRYFSDDEYITVKNFELIDEKGYHLRDFWLYRKTHDWESDWSVVD